MARTVIPFGPQHPVLPEPIHLSLVVEDEKVVEALPTLGYVHRGLEMLATKRDYNQMIQIVERVCGICSMFSMTRSASAPSLTDSTNSVFTPSFSRALRPWS